MQAILILVYTLMTVLFPFLEPSTLALCLGIAFSAGFVKGVVGFALPLVLISGLTFLLPAEMALAGLILPAVVTNVAQAMRQGHRAVWDAVRTYRVFLISGGAALFVAAHMVRIVPEAILLVAIAVPAVLFAVLQLSGWQFQLSRHSWGIEAAFGTVAGLMSGFAGVWGPPTVMFLSALGTAKYQQMQIQGVIYAAGAFALVVAHTSSGVLRAETLPFSAALILPSLLGMWCGARVLDRIDQAMFKRVTLIVLLVAGLNLIRRALFEEMSN